MSKNIIQEHTTLMKEFKSYLEAQGTNDKKMEQHVKNAELFLNAYLAKKQGVGFAEGPRLVDNYFGDWFIRNAPTPSETQIILSIASLKKLYAMLEETGQVSAADAEKMERILSTRKDDWKDAMDAYSEELAANTNEAGEEDEESGSSSPKWESKTAKFSSDVDGAEEDVDISSGFIVEGGKSDDDDEGGGQKKSGADLLFGELDFDDEFEDEEAEEAEPEADDDDDDDDDEAEADDDEPEDDL